MWEQHGQEEDDGCRPDTEQTQLRHRAVVRPRRPWGRNKSTTIMTTKATPFCHWDGTTMTTSDSATPMITLARSAPARLPKPPRMVMAKALMVSGKPTAG